MAIGGIGGKSESDTDVGLFGVQAPGSGAGGAEGSLRAWQLNPA